MSKIDERPYSPKKPPKPPKPLSSSNEGSPVDKIFTKSDFKTADEKLGSLVKSRINQFQDDKLGVDDNESVLRLTKAVSEKSGTNAVELKLNNERSVNLSNSGSLNMGMLKKSPSKTSMLLSLKSIRISGIEDSESNSLDGQIIYEGILSKMNREGKFDKKLFILTAESLNYGEIAAMNGVPDSSGMKAIPLINLIALPLADDHDHNDGRTFKILSKLKSFFLRAETESQKEEWIHMITQFSSEIQMKQLNRLHKIEETAPLWEVSVPNCQICFKTFTFFLRKHHCRNCGRCVCEPCSNEKVRILKLDEKTLFKVCNVCAKEIKDNRRYGVQSVYDN